MVDCHTHGANDDGDIVLMKCAMAEDKDDQNNENAYAFIGTINLAIGENADLEAKVAYAHEYTSDPIETPKSTRTTTTSASVPRPPSTWATLRRTSRSTPRSLRVARLFPGMSEGA